MTARNGEAEFLPEEGEGAAKPYAWKYAWIAAAVVALAVIVAVVDSLPPSGASVECGSAGPATPFWLDGAGRWQPSAAEYFQLNIAVRNTSETMKLDVSESRDRWAGAFAADDLGNRYECVRHQGRWSESSTQDTIQPRETMRDVLVIQRPVPNATRLDVAIPAKGVGLRGWFRLRVDLPKR